AGHQRGDADRHDVEVAGGQRIDGGVRAQRVGQQDDEGAEQRRGQYRQADMPPELPGTGAKQGGRLAPVLTQGVEGRIEQQHAEGNLEVGVDQDQPGLGVDVEILDPAELLEQQGEGAVEAEQDDEGEGQRYAGEVAGHGSKRAGKVAQARIHLMQRIAAEHGNQQAEDARPERHLQAVLDGLQVELRGEDLAEILQAPAVGAVQAVDRHPQQRGDLEGEEKYRERQQAQRCQPFAARCAAHLNSSRHTGLSWGTPSSSQMLPHNSVCRGLAWALRLKASPITNSGTSRSSASRPLWERSWVMPWSAVTSTW